MVAPLGMSVMYIESFRMISTPLKYHLRDGVGYLIAEQEIVIFNPCIISTVSPSLIIDGGTACKMNHV